MCFWKAPALKKGTLRIILHTFEECSSNFRIVLLCIVSIDSRACSYCSQEPRHFHDSRDSALRTRSSNARLGVHSNHQGSKSIFVTSDRLACERILSCSAGGHLGLSTYFAFFASITRGPSSQ